MLWSFEETTIVFVVRVLHAKGWEKDLFNRMNIYLMFNNSFCNLMKYVTDK